MMSNKQIDKLISCPYNLAHQIQSHKMQTHLEKCRKSHKKDVAKKHCPFDATHLINELELDYHITVCNKREQLDRVMYNIDSGMQYKPSTTGPTPVVESEENWDDDDFSSYNPLESKPPAPDVLLRPRGLQPAERRAFRMEQRTKYGANHRD